MVLVVMDHSQTILEEFGSYFEENTVPFLLISKLVEYIISIYF